MIFYNYAKPTEECENEMRKALSTITRNFANQMHYRGASLKHQTLPCDLTYQK